jgi:hypothetical protein
MIVATLMSWRMASAPTGACFTACKSLTRGLLSYVPGRVLPRNSRRNGFGSAIA